MLTSRIMCSRPSIRVVVALLLCSLAAVHVDAGQQATSSQATALQEFGTRVTQYADLHKRLATRFGEVDSSKSQAEIAQRATVLGNAIRAARTSAKPGDIFAPSVAAALKPIIRAEYRRRSAPVRETREEAQEELPDFVPRVNELYPTTFPLATFPATLLRVLPPLPPEVEYRIVTHYLILRDLETNLVIDILPNAIP